MVGSCRRALAVGDDVSARRARVRQIDLADAAADGQLVIFYIVMKCRDWW